MDQEYLCSVFAMSHTDVRIQPFHNHGRTLRLIVHANVSAHALRVRFANWCGEVPLPIGAASLALCDAQGSLRPDTLKPLTVGGVLTFTLEPGKDILSDELTFQVRPGDYIALNIYYPSDERVVSGNWVSHRALRSRPGNFSADLSLPQPNLLSRFARTVIVNDMTVSVTSVCEIIAHSDTKTRVLACFGDSITQQGNWTLPLSKRLNRTYPGQISLCNLGISGNRLLHDSTGTAGGLNGIAGIRRFERDLLPMHGLTHTILEIGSNDIGEPGGQGIPEDELITPAQYAEAMQRLANTLHERNVRVYVATIPPRPFTSPYTEEREPLRLAMNDWIRTAPCFDAVLDFDAVLRRDDGKPGMKDGCSLPDKLHPSPYGGLLVAKSIDLSLFGE